ncbi:MAG TPA: hypothetical protein VNL14_23265 [Candidatus Acidoferrales bacterium]|nr:hypothetical protein [Candidatus Acidoferrales bacterium]
MFAADLYEVLTQRGKRPIYEKTEEFFALTFPTYNLRQLVRDVVLRLAGKNDKAVRQLELTYGGGKTHTLITLAPPGRRSRQAAQSSGRGGVCPGHRPETSQVPRGGAVLRQTGRREGHGIASPAGKVRTLKQPWSILAYQIAGDEGLKLLHAGGKAEERDSAPAGNLLTQLLELPAGDGLGTLILVDEVLMYARA